MLLILCQPVIHVVHGNMTCCSQHPWSSPSATELLAESQAPSNEEILSVHYFFLFTNFVSGNILHQQSMNSGTFHPQEVNPIGSVTSMFTLDAPPPPFLSRWVPLRHNFFRLLLEAIYFKTSLFLEAPSNNMFIYRAALVHRLLL